MKRTDKHCESFLNDTIEFRMDVVNRGAITIMPRHQWHIKRFLSGISLRVANLDLIDHNIDKMAEAMKRAIKSDIQMRTDVLGKPKP